MTPRCGSPSSAINCSLSAPIPPLRFTLLQMSRVWHQRRFFTSVCVPCRPREQSRLSRVRVRSGTAKARLLVQDFGAAIRIQWFLYSNLCGSMNLGFPKQDKQAAFIIYIILYILYQQIPMLPRYQNNELSALENMTCFPTPTPINHIRCGITQRTRIFLLVQMTVYEQWGS
jgi:hypothetical protein